MEDGCSERMAQGLRTPQQAAVENWIALIPILIAKRSRRSKETQIIMLRRYSSRAKGHKADRFALRALVISTQNVAASLGANSALMFVSCSTSACSRSQSFSGA